MAIFLKYNSKDGINPELLKMVFGEGTTDDIEFGNVTLARIQRGMLKQTVSGDTLVPNLKKVANNIQFFIDCKKIDQLIEDEGEHKPLQDDFNAYFATNPVLYMTDDGKYLDHNFNKTDNEDEAITFQEFLIEHYTMFAIMNKQIPGLMDDQNNPIMFD